MSTKEYIDRLFLTLTPYAGELGLLSVEIIILQEGSAAYSESKTYKNNYQSQKYDDLVNGELIPPAATAGPVQFRIPGDSPAEAHCLLVPLIQNSSRFGYLLYQSEKKFDDARTTACSLFTGAASLILGMKPSETPGSDKYKSELIKMRTSQAELFPRFEEIVTMDISAIFLPADLMTGTFIDAFFIDSNQYQIIGCEIFGSDPSSAVAGASVRTLARSLSTKQIVPSSLIERIISRLEKILPGIHSLINLAVYKINTKTGLVVISSYGNISTYFYSAKKKGLVDLAQTSIGKDLLKKIIFKDINIHLEQADSLLYRTQSVASLNNENKTEMFGEDRLKKAFLEQSQNPSKDVVHSITDEMYTFSNYSPLEKDIALLCIKMN